MFEKFFPKFKMTFELLLEVFPYSAFAIEKVSVVSILFFKISHKIWPVAVCAPSLLQISPKIEFLSA